ncbi:MAG: L,D-transpeptidase [Candidatus Roizmanbacteria bacterium]|nr:L,D-transpeptidase [Candidatus Roizmanbacteria bacterium]
MKNKLITGLTFALFIASISVFLFPDISLVQRFSPQATAYPHEAVERFDEEASLAIVDNKPVQIPPSVKQAYLAVKPSSQSDVLAAFDGLKRIEVDLTNQRLYAYEGNNRVMDFLVSTGKWGKTPTGVFNIWIKLRSTKMEGGSKELGTYYYLPNVPFTMFFANDEIPRWRGFGIHGTYWHSNFGHPMSHGCVNMKTEEVERLYYWALPDLQGKSSINASDENPGTPVIIYGEAPWG